MLRLITLLMAVRADKLSMIVYDVFIVNTNNTTQNSCCLNKWKRTICLEINKEMINRNLQPGVTG